MIDRRAAEAVVKALEVQNEVAKLTLDAIEEAVLRTNVNREVTYLNRMAERLTGWCRNEALGRPVSDVLRITEGASVSTIRDALEIMSKDRVVMPTATCTPILVRRDGIELGIENTATPIHDQDGIVTGSVVVFHDVSAARAKSLEMSRLAQHDSVDSGTEFTSRVVDQWAYQNQVALHFIERGKPTQNALIESFNGKFRDEC